MLACAIMGYLSSLSMFFPRQYIQSQWQFVKVFVLACIFCSSVVLGNVSLKYIPVSFNQVPPLTASDEHPWEWDNVFAWQANA